MATISYRLEFVPHPWNEKKRAEGMKAWCLVKRVEPELGAVQTEVVAIFNLDSEAETFAGHCYRAEILCRGTVDVGDDFRRLFEAQEGATRRVGATPKER